MGRLLQSDLTNEVTVVFKDSAVTIPVTQGMTLGDLAALTAHLGTQHASQPVYVRVRQ